MTHYHDVGSSISFASFTMAVRQEHADVCIGWHLCYPNWNFFYRDIWEAHASQQNRWPFEGHLKTHECPIDMIHGGVIIGALTYFPMIPISDGLSGGWMPGRCRNCRRLCPRFCPRSAFRCILQLYWALNLFRKRHYIHWSSSFQWIAQP